MRRRLRIQPRELASMFAPPSWLRDLGLMAWLLVGIFALFAGVAWLLSLTDTIVIPVIVATIIAAVLSPVVRSLAGRMPRAAAAAIVFVGMLIAAIALIALVIVGITSHATELHDNLQAAASKLQDALQDLGASAEKAQAANHDASATISSAFHFLLSGLTTGIQALASVAVFLSFTALSLFFLLKDGPQIRAWTERHMGIPESVARTVTARTLQSLRGYFAGVTAVAAFNGILIGLGAVVLGVPQAGAIALVNFIAAYVPYIGAWTAGVFTVLVAFGAAGETTALIMGVIVLLTNGALQQMVQPIAFGTTLGIHPLAVLIVTIAGGALFGTVGLVIAAPLTSAAAHISVDLARARAGTAAAEAEPSSPPEPGGSAATT